MIERAEGARLWDVSGQIYIDYVMGFGPLLLGHTPKDIIAATEAQARRGFLFGAAHSAEVELAESLAACVPCAQSVLLSNTGSEAVHVALRLARAYTGRRKIVKFEGAYHGWLDPMCYATPGQPPSSPLQAIKTHRASTQGISPTNDDLIVLSFNDASALRDVIHAQGDEIAAIILEPVPQAGAIEPQSAFLQALRDVCDASGAVLIFDEVVTGFRLALGGAQERYALNPDLCVLGKALGAGYPISAIVGRADILAQAADGRTPHMGTFNGHALCVAASRAALRAYQEPHFYPRLERISAMLANGLHAMFAENSLNLRVNQVGALISLTGLPPDARLASYADLAAAKPVAAFAEALLRRGVHVQARGVLMLSAAHTEGDIEETLSSARAACLDLKEKMRS